MSLEEPFSHIKTDIHELTSCSPNGRDKNQIDRLMIDGTHLVTAFIKLKLRSAGRRMTTQRHFDIEKLCDPKMKSAFFFCR